MKAFMKVVASAALIAFVVLVNDQSSLRRPHDPSTDDDYGIGISHDLSVDDQGKSPIPNDESESSNSSTRKLIFHVGPPKHASTYLHCVLPQIDHILQQDNWKYIGVTSKNHCIPDGNRTKYMIHGSNDFSTDKLFRLLNETTMNVIIVMEYNFWTLPPWFPRLFKRVFQDFDIQLVAGYRPMYDFLPSWWNQKEKCACHRKCHKWEDCPFCTPLSLTSGAWAPQIQRLIRDGRHLAQTSVQGWRKHLPGAKVEIIDMKHLVPAKRGNSLLTHFVCNTITSATDTCRHVTDGRAESAGLKNNAYMYLDYDILAEQAYKQNLLPGTMSRSDAVKAIKNHQEKNLNLTVHDFMQKCLDNKTLEFIMDFTLETEKKLLSVDAVWTPWQEETELDDMQREETHRLRFNRMRSSKYCFIDPVKTIADSNWQAFFSSLQ